MSDLNTYVDELRPGTILQGRYKILERVGGGGMGIVYKALDMRVANRVVAIKELKQDNLSGEELERARKRFAREAAILSLVQHEHLPRIYDLFEDQDHSYLVMDFIEGKTLQQLLKQDNHPLQTLQVLDYAIQLCDVLTHLHQRYEPIIFRDLKPSNIMIRPDGYVFLIDFGIARNFKPGQKDDTEVFRTPGYAAPEVGFAQTDSRADIFSLGVTMHQCLTRQALDYFDHNQAFPPARQFNAEVSEELSDLIARMVQFKPGDRPTNADEVGQQLERIYQQVLSTQARFGQSAQREYRPLSFYSDDTEAGQPVFWRNPARPQAVTPLVRLPVLLVTGLMWLLTPLVIRARQVTERMISTGMRQAIYDRYLYVRVRLNAASLWTDRFLLLLFALLASSVALSAAIYTRFGNSTARVEFGLVVVLLVTTIISGGLLRNAVARHIMLFTGILVGVAFLALLASPTYQVVGTNGARQPITFNLLLTYGLVTLTLIALVGSIASMRARVSAALPPTQDDSLAASEFVRLGHFAVAAIAGLCFLLQLAFGSQEQIPFASFAPRPFAFVFSFHPFISSNSIPLIALGLIALYELKRYSQPFIGRDRVVVFALSIIFMFAQYAFGLNELNHIFPGNSTITLASLNLLLFGVPLVLALLALPYSPDDLAWVGLVPAFALSLSVALLQGYLGGQESISLFAATGTGNGQQSMVSFAQLTSFGQINFACLAVAGGLLVFRIIFARKRPSLMPGVADRIALLVVALGCASVLWAFWQGVLQHTLAFDYARQGTTLLYAALASLAFGLVMVVAALVSAIIASFDALSHPSQAHPRAAKVVLSLNRLAALSSAIVTLMLLNFFGNRGGWLAHLNHLSDMSSSLPNFFFTNSEALLSMLIPFAFFTLILLFRPNSAFGRLERITLLLSSVGAMLLLTDAGDVQALPFFSLDMQQIAGKLATSLSVDRVVAGCILLAALLSFFWLTRTHLLGDRLVLLFIFGVAFTLALADAISTRQLLLVPALLAIMQGVLIASKIEKVRRGNT
jgi:tRNA A-37 threonylcarbamoyl transferase component Bud32